MRAVVLAAAVGVVFVGVWMFARDDGGRVPTSGEDLVAVAGGSERAESEELPELEPVAARDVPVEMTAGEGQRNAGEEETDGLEEVAGRGGAAEAVSPREESERIVGRFWRGGSGLDGSRREFVSKMQSLIADKGSPPEEKEDVLFEAVAAYLHTLAVAEENGNGTNGPECALYVDLLREVYGPEKVPPGHVTDVGVARVIYKKPGEGQR